MPGSSSPSELNKTLTRIRKRIQKGNERKKRERREDRLNAIGRKTDGVTCQVAR